MTSNHRFIRHLLFTTIALSSLLNWAHAQSFTSKPQQASLIELYTSEGCSSCPPADAWLSQLTDHSDLWTKLVPIAFHVDYWDWIGWKDDLARPEFGERQKTYKALGNTRSVYTPGFFVNGREWKGFFKKPSSLPTGTSQQVGILSAELKDSVLSVAFKPTYPTKDHLQVHAAVLHFGKSHFIKWGENIGKTLSHDFISGPLVSQDTSFADNAHRARLQLSIPAPSEPEKQAVAIWITTADGKNVIQATGGWLSD